MSEQGSPHQIEFIRLNGVTIRVTSWRPGSRPGTYDLVTITRGSRDAETLDELFRQSRLTLEIGSAAAQVVTAERIDRRTVGEGQAGITRYAITLADAAAEPFDTTQAQSGPTLDERVATLEAEVRALRSLIEMQANGIRH